ncbi:MAG: hypothetical protein QME92_09520 [Bacillota bacterium]|nr:hypothetical protein [Bacillota bacterium]
MSRCAVVPVVRVVLRALGKSAGSLVAGDGPLPAPRVFPRCNGCEAADQSARAEWPAG